MSEIKLKEKEKELKNIKEDLEIKQKNRDQLQGKLDSLMERLEKDYDLKTLEEAQEELKALSKEIEVGEKQITKEYNEILDMVEEIE